MRRKGRLWAAAAAATALAIPAAGPTAPAQAATRAAPQAATQTAPQTAPQAVTQAPAAPRTPRTPQPSPSPTGPPDDPAEVWSRIQVAAHISLPRTESAVSPDPRVEFIDGAKSLPKPRNLTFVIDASGLRGIATVKVTNKRCTAEGAVITCGFDKYLRTPDKAFSVTAVGDAAAKGKSGTIRYTLTGDRVTESTDTTRVTVGTPGMEVAQLPHKEGLKPGQDIGLPVVLRNTGDLRTEQIALKVAGDAGLKLAGRHSNCHYRVGSYGDYDSEATCYFKRAVRPGETVALASPLPGSLTSDAFHTWATYSAEAVPAEEDTSVAGDAGSGPELGLVPARGRGTDFAPEHVVRYAARNTADVRAQGDTLQPGAKGATRELSFGLLNAGPALVARPLREPALYVDVTLPKGVVATSVQLDEEPDEKAGGDCFTYENGERKPFRAGHRRYLCPDAGWQDSGDSQSFHFEVRYEKDVEDVRGTVRVRSGDADRPGDGGFEINDPVPSNDKAEIVVGKATADAQTRPMAEAGAGVLPWIAAGAAALLGVGAVVFATVRRRSE
ncbi:hypothetical protein AB0E78_07940 [Streptomyces sp. NPDC032198]|uniref:hypothetical protein n=1 Tax=Streptomyces sp. NPDC032198 TaxID=3155127 RepID=UPI0033FC7B7C